MYLAHIIEVHNVWPSKFFEYHKLLSGKCAIAFKQNQMLINWSEGDEKILKRVVAGPEVSKCNFCGSTTHTEVCAWTIKKTEETANIIVVYRGKTNMIAILLIMKANTYAIISIPTDVPCLIAEELMCVQTVCQHHIENRIVLVYVWKRTSLQVYQKIRQRNKRLLSD